MWVCVCVCVFVGGGGGVTHPNKEMGTPAVCATAAACQSPRQLALGVCRVRVRAHAHPHAQHNACHRHCTRHSRLRFNDVRLVSWARYEPRAPMSQALPRALSEGAPSVRVCACGPVCVRESVRVCERACVCECVATVCVCVGWWGGRHRRSYPAPDYVRAMSRCMRASTAGPRAWCCSATSLSHAGTLRASPLHIFNVKRGVLVAPPRGSTAGSLSNTATTCASVAVAPHGSGLT